MLGETHEKPKVFFCPNLFPPKQKQRRWWRTSGTKMNTQRFSFYSKAVVVVSPRGFFAGEFDNDDNDLC